MQQCLTINVINIECFIQLWRFSFTWLGYTKRPAQKVFTQCTVVILPTTAKLFLQHDGCGRYISYTLCDNLLRWSLCVIKPSARESLQMNKTFPSMSVTFKVKCCICLTSCIWIMHYPMTFIPVVESILILSHKHLQTEHWHEQLCVLCT